MEAPHKIQTETSYAFIIYFDRRGCTFEKAMKISKEFTYDDCIFHTCTQYAVGNEYHIILKELPSKDTVNEFQNHMKWSGAEKKEVYLCLRTSDGYIEKYEPIDLYNLSWDYLPASVRRAEQPKFWFEA